MSMRILIAGGGTGGHVYPALAIIESLKSLADVEVLYVGGRGGVENKIVPQFGLPMKTIWVSGFARQLSLKNLLFPLKLVVSLWQSLVLIMQFKPSVSVGCGGYVTGPVLWVAARLGIPVLIQEQDVHPGVTSRLLASSAQTICLSFADAAVHFEDQKERLVVSGNPVRSGLSGGNREESLEKWGLSSEKLTLFVFGGSQGAKALNDMMVQVWPLLEGKDKLQLIWQTGPSTYAAFESAARGKEDMVILPYIDDMAAAYAAADIIICRAGASSLAELALLGKAAVLVPYPYAAGDHQARNAAAMESAGAAIMVKEGEGWMNKAREAIQTLINSPEKRQSQRKSWQKMARPEAGETIAKEILKLSEHGTAKNK